MKKPHQDLSVQVKREDWELTLQGEPVLSCTLTWPELAGGGKGTAAINRYYRHAAGMWRSRWEREVFLHACLDLADRRARSRPFKPWQVQLTTHITLRTDELLSLWQEGTEQQGFERPLSLRRGDTWSVADGAPRTLASFFPGERRWKKRMLEQLERQARHRLEQGESLLDPDCPQRLKGAFDPQRFYLSAEGIQVFYPMYVLGPGAEGIPVFSIPLSPAG
ncbi:MAG: DUF3298 domain-containing protein [Oscillospiraceae bacterium]|nr:DUF3298 domain-containing protein [Oscillospiraceae bacterium]